MPAWTSAGRLAVVFDLPLPAAMTFPCTAVSLWTEFGDDDPADLLFAFLVRLDNDPVVQTVWTSCVCSVW